MTVRVSLTLGGVNGSHDLILEVDTGFYGQILIPYAWARLMTADFEPNPAGVHMADGTLGQALACALFANWHDENREIEVLALLPPPPGDGRIEPYALPATNHHRSGKPDRKSVV